MSDKLDIFIDSVHHLPPSPRLLITLLEVFKQPDQDIEEVVKLISHDPSFTVEVLKRCNSACFGTDKPAENMFEAVSRLGFTEIYNIVVAMFAATAILRPEARGGHVEVLWRHSVAVGVAAGVLADAAGESNPAAFTAGLLHEVGKVVLISANKGKYMQAVLDAGMLKRPMLVAEKDQFGFDHAEVGARLLARWNLPPNIVAAVGHHHNLAGSEPFERFAAVIHLANIIAHATAEKLEGELKLPSAATASLSILQFPPEHLAELLPLMNEGLQTAKALNPG